MVSKPFVGENDETAKDDIAGYNAGYECAWVKGELKSVLGYKGPLVNLRLPITGVSL